MSSALPASASSVIVTPLSTPCPTLRPTPHDRCRYAIIFREALTNLGLALVAVLVMQRLVPFTIIKALKITGNFVNKKPALFLQMLLEEYLERSSEAVIHEQLLPLYMKPEYSSLTQTLSMYLMKQFPKYLKHSQMEKTAVAGIKIKSAIALKALRGTAM